MSEDFKWEWVAIPHFYHTPFYVYAYAFGKLLVLSLYKQFKAEGEIVQDRNIVRSSQPAAPKLPRRSWAKPGIDIRSAKFWQGGFDVIKEQVEELERL